MTPTSAVEATLDAAGAGGGVVAVRNNVNRGWRAELPDGSSAPPLVVDGWQQAWHVPEGVASLDLRYVPDRAYRTALAVGALLLVLLALGTLLLRRRGPRPASGPAPCGTRVAPWVVPVAGVSALALVGGWWGLAAGFVGAAASVLARRWVAGPSVAWGGRAARGGRGTRLLVASAGLRRRLGGGAACCPSCWWRVALGALVVADLDLRGQTLRSRRAGRSTTR